MNLNVEDVVNVLFGLRVTENTIDPYDILKSLAGEELSKNSKAIFIHLLRLNLSYFILINKTHLQGANKSLNEWSRDIHGYDESNPRYVISESDLNLLITILLHNDIYGIDSVNIIKDDKILCSAIVFATAFARPFGFGDVVSNQASRRFGVLMSFAKMIMN